MNFLIYIRQTIRPEGTLNSPPALSVSCYIMTNLRNIFQVAFVLGMPIAFVLIYFRTLNSKTANVLQSLPQNAKAIYFDVRVWFKGYDPYKKKKQFQINPLKALYTFNIADLYVQADKLIVVGKTKVLGKTILLQPFAICWTGRQFEAVNVTLLTRQIKTEVIGNDVEIEFEDFEYTNTIKLVVKKIGQELYQQIESS